MWGLEYDTVKFMKVELVYNRKKIHGPEEKKFYLLRWKNLLKQNFLHLPVILSQQILVYICLKIKHHYIIKVLKKINVQGHKLCGHISIYSFHRAF